MTEKAAEKIFAVEKLKGNTLEYFTFYHGFFLFGFVYIFAFSQSIIKGKKLTKRLCAFS